MTHSILTHHCPADKRKYVIIVAFLASAMGFIDGTIVAIALPQISTALDATFGQAQWISNAYILTLSAFILIGGGLGDKLGVKTVFIGGIILFVVASVICALAWSAESLIAFRALQGIGAAIMLPGSMSLIAKNTPRAERGKAMGIWIASSASTTAIGPFLGGFLLTYGGADSWRLIFALNIPIGLLALILLWKHVPRDEPSSLGGISKLDWTGAGLLTIALALLASGLTFLAESNDKNIAVSLLLAGLVFSIIAVWWELRTKDAMIDMALFRLPAFTSANIVTFLIWSGMGAVTFFLPMLVIVAWKLPASYAGSMFLPFSGLIAILSPLSGRLVDRLGVRLIMSVGSVIFGFGCLSFAWAIVQQEFWMGLLPSFVIIGLGIGLIGPTISTTVVNSVPENRTGAASGINNLLARVSFLFAVAGLGVFVSYVYALVIKGSSLHSDVQVMMIDAGFGRRLSGGLYQVATVELQVLAMNHAMIALFIMLAVLSVFAAVLGWLSQPANQSTNKPS